ncbi:MULTISPECIES: nicotinate (nicotinamide) nucleotide adenylyltransferase [Candidatus Cardinium]|uniref:nicotinate (nicotinamide) nucleotide adenylyltransferase n=1 Tax=Candidatus Cardinium TaxID=273135 RepID=UPI001FAA9CCA|nr:MULTISPECIES: nicotinate (nicotinamide) nucleotide adenylyltransferase [Cardinium]
MSGEKKIVLLSCGSFNPITIWHLRMFELAKDYFKRMGGYCVTGGIISPTHDSYQTPKQLECGEHRCQMARLALTPLYGRNHWVRVDDWETKQHKWHRTIEVIDYQCNKLNEVNTTLKLLCGADLFSSFHVPNLWNDQDIELIVRKYGLVVITREGFDPFNTLKNSPKSHIFRKYQRNVIIIEEKIKNRISSTAIRHCIKNRESIRYLVPDSVIEYINANNLYLFDS